MNRSDFRMETGSGRHYGEKIAVVGMACRFPGASDTETFWSNIAGKQDCVSDVPPERWDPEKYYDPSGKDPEKLYARRGGYLKSPFVFDPAEFGIMPKAVKGGEPDQFLVLKTAAEALNDAGITPCGPECAKGSFILGRGSYITAGAHNLVQRSLIAEQTASIVREMVPGFTEDQASELKSDLVTRLMPFGSEAAPSVMPNISAGRVANRLGLMGPNYTIDAACASSLFALDAAARDLASGRSDLALAGGVHIFNNVAFLNVFCALGAMSRQDRICPFDSKADGLLPGEGAGIVVLKRLSDAERDGSRIYAVISGIGTSSDGRSTGVAAPAVDGEVLALERAYRAAGVETRTVELLEAHGTATAAGDAAEIESLRRVFGEKGENEPRTCALGSVKSMIGHAMPAAGIAGFIKAAMSLYHRILPPTINCETPNPEFGLDQTPFYISTETRPWFKTSHDVPRRAGVNAFGFGGVNAHVVLEQYGSKGSLPDGAADIRMPAENPGDSLRWDAALFLFSSETRDGLAEKCTKTAESIENQGRACVFALCEKILSSYVAGRHRLAVVAGSAGDLAKKLRQASARLSEPERSRIKDAKGIYYFSSPLGKTGKTAFMFPGEGSSYTNMMMDLCLYFPAVRRSFERINCAVTSRYENRTFPATRFVFPAAMLTEDEKKALEAEFWKVDSGLQAILASSLAVNELLSGFGVVPDMIAGHSAGEYSAWIASGILDTDDFHQKQEDIARVYAESGSQRIQTSMTAVSAGRKKVEPLVEQIEGEIHISNDNCPHQVVVVGEAGAMERFRERLKSEKIFYTDLPSGEVHHTPLAADQEKPLYKAFSGLDIRTPETTVYSAVSAGPYPENKDEILDLMVGYWLRPLAFRQTVEKMYEDGARIFVEVGPGNNLCGFVDDTLRGKPVMTAASNTPRRSGPAQFCHVLAMLAAQHVPVLVEPMIAAAGKMARFPDKSGQGSRSRKPSKTAVNMDLALPELGLAKDAAVKWREKISAGQQPRNSSPAQKEPGGIEEAGGSGPMHRYLETMSRFLDLQKQVAELASGAGRQGGNIKSRRRLALPPFTGRITVRQPGKRAEIRSRLDLEKDLFLRDHRFGSMPSDRDGTLLPLIVVPFVLTLEMMAEAAMHVFPGKRPVEIRRAKASRWIAVDEKKGAQITAVAKALSSGTASAFLSEQGSGRKSAEAEIVFTDKYPGPFEFEYEPVRPDKFGSDAQAAASEIYREKYMTHGPAFQVIKAVSMPEQQVMEAALCAPDPAGFFSFRTGAGMLINPVLLDACAQLTGFWAQKRLSQRFITFPSGAGSISFFSDPPAAGDHLGCRIRISEITSGFVHSEAEIFRRDLSLWAQVKDWTHIRFDLPLEMYQVWRFPQKYGLSRVIEPGGGNLQKEGVECGLPDLESIDGTIWKEAMARLYLGRAERNAYSGGTVSNPGRWLAEMMAAKDAAKEYVKLNFGGEIAPADIEIGENGDQGNFAASVPAAADGSGRLELCIVRRQGRIRAIPHNAAKQ